MNLASALTGGFAVDININQSTVNLGNQLMFMGIVVLEIPCNMALQRIGPRKWIAGQVFAFGLVATLQVFLKNRVGFLVSRLALGLAEAGYIPGAVYTLSTWYTRRELSKRVAVLFFGMFGGFAISPLLASGILKLDNARGLRGWQWLFLRRFSRHLLIRPWLTAPSRRTVHYLCVLFPSFLPSRKPGCSQASGRPWVGPVFQRGDIRAPSSS